MEYIGRATELRCLRRGHRAPPTLSGHSCSGETGANRLTRAVVVAAVSESTELCSDQPNSKGMTLDRNGGFRGGWNSQLNLSFAKTSAGRQVVDLSVLIRPRSLR